MRALTHRMSSGTTSITTAASTPATVRMASSMHTGRLVLISGALVLLGNHSRS